MSVNLRTARRQAAAMAAALPALMPTVHAAPAPGTPTGAPALQSEADCAKLTGRTVSAAAIGLPTRGAVVLKATSMPATGTGVAAVGPYCKVEGQIAPVDRKAPPISFQLNLPAQWNGKGLMFGGGGYNGTVATGGTSSITRNGSTITLTGNVPAGPVDQRAPLSRGYATFGSDSGHQAGLYGSRDGSFGANEEARRNFAGDALKKTRDTAADLIKAYYGRDAQRTYFAGGSTGGREALLAVGRWPRDFDGAIALYPAWNAAVLNLHFGRMTRALAQPGAFPGLLQRQALYKAALQACDPLDGVEDGLISNQAACDAGFDPATATLGDQPLRCAAGTTGDACLTDAQIAAFKVLNSPTVPTFALPSGEKSYPGLTTWGTDFGFTAPNPAQSAVLTLGLGTDAPSAYPMTPVRLASLTGVATSPPYGSTFWDQWVRYFVTDDTMFNALALDPERPGVWQQRIVQLIELQDANRSDFSAFRARGGKLLLAHGVHDALVSNRATQQFVARVRRAMGEAATADFLRYYEIPGYGHSVSNQFGAAWDSLTALENWVERGVAPVNQVVMDTVGVPDRTRPLCEYPAWPRYQGTGDVNQASSFTCATR
jgi:feruloyl esterase